jgi:hypothetical protein
MASIRDNLMRFNFSLQETLGLVREVNRKEPLVRFTSKTEKTLEEELKTSRLTTNEE